MKKQYERVIRKDMNGMPFIPNRVVRFKGDKYCGGNDGFDDIFERLFELENMIENGELDFTPLYYARKFVEFYAENSLSSEEIAKKMYDLLGGKTNE